MNRRAFLPGISTLVGGIAIEKAIPFGRVWSFPTQIKCVNAGLISDIEEALEYLWANYAVAPDHFIGPIDSDICKYYHLSSDPCREWESIVNA